MSEFTVLAQWWSGSESTLIAEDPDVLKYVGKEHHIVVANHKYDIDWVALWILAERVGMLGVSFMLILCVFDKVLICCTALGF